VTYDGEMLSVFKNLFINTHCDNICARRAKCAIRGINKAVFTLLFTECIQEIRQNPPDTRVHGYPLILFHRSQFQTLASVITITREFVFPLNPAPMLEVTKNKNTRFRYDRATTDRFRPTGIRQYGSVNSLTFFENPVNVNSPLLRIFENDVLTK
jgi:hypothetical protein